MLHLYEIWLTQPRSILPDAPIYMPIRRVEVLAESAEDALRATRLGTPNADIFRIVQVVVKQENVGEPSEMPSLSSIN